MGEITQYLNRSQPLFFVVELSDTKTKRKEHTEKIPFHSTAHIQTSYVGAKDHHQNTYCNTPKNEY